MSAQKAVPATTERLLSDLQQLVEALDRRLPRLKGLGEAEIARDAADLRARAVKRIQELQRT